MYLSFSEYIGAKYAPPLQDELSLFRGEVDLHTGGNGGVDKAVDDGGDLLLHCCLITVRVTQILNTT